MNKSKRWLNTTGKAFLLMIVTIGFPMLSSYIMKMTRDKMVQLFIMCLICGCIVLFEYFIEDDSFLNGIGIKMNKRLFIPVYSLSMIITSFFPFLPVLAWPFLSLALLFCLYFSLPMSLLTYSIMLTSCSIVKGTDLSVFLLYFICGLIVIILFSKLDYDYKIGVPIFISLCTFIIGATANVTIFNDHSLDFETFFLPAVNIFVSIVLMITILKSYSALFMHKYRDCYMTINDTEFSLLSDLKKSDSKAYYRAIHTSYLTDKLGVKFNLNMDSIKTGSYYWKICENHMEEDRSMFLEKLQKEYHFPPDSILLINELLKSNHIIISKEAIIVFIADDIIDRLTKLFEKDKNIVIYYKQYFNTFFDDKMEEGFFNSCEFTMKDINTMKKIFIEEALYYDFLR